MPFEMTFSEKQNQKPWTLDHTFAPATRIWIAVGSSLHPSRSVIVLITLRDVNPQPSVITISLGTFPRRSEGPRQTTARKQACDGVEQTA